MRLAIITVIYQNYTVLEDYLNSLRKQSDQDFHLFIADLSKDRKKIDVEDVPIIVIDGENHGYAHGVNICLKKAIEQNYDAFCVMNTDTFFESEFIEKMKLSLEHYPNALIGGKIYYAPGYEYHQDRYKKEDKGYVLWYAGGTIDWKNVYVSHRGVDELDQGQYDHFEDTEFISGCLMYFDKSVVDTIGFWDSSYFLYYEDTDYCVRAKKAGLRLYYDPSVIIWHKNAQSTDGSGSKLHEHYQNRNRLRFGFKYAPLKTKLHLLKNQIFTLFHFLK